jgi:hypothetical protein
MYAWTQTSINRHARFLDYKNRGNDVGRHRRRYRHHDARLGLLGGDCSVLRSPGAARQLADCGEKSSSLSLLGDYYCPRDIRHDNGGFRRSLVGIGYTGGSSLLLICLMATLGLWYWALGSISVDTINTPKVEVFYWAAITFSQTPGTAGVTGRPIRPALDTKAERWYSAPRWRLSRQPVTGPMYPG